MVMLDIDHFKLFNDRYGHVTGDACIKRVSACVRAELRGDDDLAVRYGGEELLVVLPGSDEPEAARIAEGSAARSRRWEFRTKRSGPTAR